MSQTVDDLLDQLRTQLDESNITDVSDEQLLQALNRAQRSATNTVSRQYEAMFWKETTISTDGTNILALPKDAFGRKVEMVEVVVGSARYPLKRLNNHQTSPLIGSGSTTRPSYYALTKNEIRIFPTPASGLTMYVSYIKRPEPLVKSQGRISSSSGSDILVDALGASLTTTTEGFGAYINIVDYSTGEIKGTLQIAALDTDLDKITCKSSGLTRSSVLGRTIDTALPSDIQADDYVCLVTGTAVSELDEAYTDFLIQFAVVEIKRRFGEDISQELPALDALKDELKSMWAGRESSHKLRRSNMHYHGYNLRKTVI